MFSDMATTKGRDFYKDTGCWVLFYNPTYQPKFLFFFFGFIHFIIPFIKLSTQVSLSYKWIKRKPNERETLSSSNITILGEMEQLE